MINTKRFEERNEDDDEVRRFTKQAGTQTHRQQTYRSGQGRECVFTINADVNKFMYPRFENFKSQDFQHIGERKKEQE